MSGMAGRNRAATGDEARPSRRLPPPGRTDRGNIGTAVTQQSGPSLPVSRTHSIGGPTPHSYARGAMPCFTSRKETRREAPQT
jgi:hypothetical protein